MCNTNSINQSFVWFLKKCWYVFWIQIQLAWVMNQYISEGVDSRINKNINPLDYSTYGTIRIIGKSESTLSASVSVISVLSLCAAGGWGYVHCLFVCCCWNGSVWHVRGNQFWTISRRQSLSCTFSLHLWPTGSMRLLASQEYKPWTGACNFVLLTPFPVLPHLTSPPTHFLSIQQSASIHHHHISAGEGGCQLLCGKPRPSMPGPLHSCGGAIIFSHHPAGCISPPSLLLKGSLFQPSGRRRWAQPGGWRRQISIWSSITVDSKM